jgi:hypothetical protein
MKPLASWAALLRDVGALSVLGGAGCLAGVATTSRSAAAVLAFLLAAAIYGGLMYVLSVRPQLLKAVASARELPHATREARWVTIRRLALPKLVAALAFVGLVFLIGDLSLVGGASSSAEACARSLRRAGFGTGSASVAWSYS